MELTVSYAVQLGVALGFGLLIFALAYNLPTRYVLGPLIILIPFQIIDSRFGTINMVLTYLIGMGFLLNGRVRKFPLIGVVSAIFVLYLVSTSQALRQTWFDHILHIVSVGSGFLLFYIVYNAINRESDIRYFLRLLVVMNVLVILYSIINITVGFERFVPLGIQEFAFKENVEGSQRLVGAFGAAGQTAEYYALQCLILGYAMIGEKRKFVTYFLIGIICVNAGLIIASGSRGSFLVLLGGSFLFLLMFRQELGSAKIFRYGITGAVAAVIGVAVIANLPQFSNVFDRFTGTQFENYVPDTRQEVFSIAVERIPDAPVLGHGPRLRLIDEEQRSIAGYEAMPAFPHNLYLHLLYTLGVTGLLLYGLFFLNLGRRFWIAQDKRTGSEFLDGLPKLGVVVLTAFLIDQLKIEFLRTNVSDLQHYLFTIWALLLASSDHVRISARRVRQAPTPGETSDQSPSAPLPLSPWAPVGQQPLSSESNVK